MPSAWTSVWWVCRLRRDRDPLTVTAPPNGNIAPPGYYMLFLLNSSGVPSLASWIL